MPCLGMRSATDCRSVASDCLAWLNDQLPIAQRLASKGEPGSELLLDFPDGLSKIWPRYATSYRLPLGSYGRPAWLREQPISRVTRRHDLKHMRKSGVTLWRSARERTAGEPQDPFLCRRERPGTNDAKRVNIKILLRSFSRCLGPRWGGQPEEFAFSEPFYF